MMQDPTKTEKLFVLTGTNGGVGLEIAKHLISSGFRNLVCHYRSSHEHISRLLESNDIDVGTRLIKANLNDENEVELFKETVIKNFGHADVLLNIAGSSSNAMSWKLSLDQFQSAISDNLLTAFLCTRAFLPGMRERASGRIINFTSIVGSTGVVGASHYCASKAALMGYTKSVALEVANKEITVNAIALGYMSTGLIEDVPMEMQSKLLSTIPLRRFGSSADVGSLVEFISSSEAGWFTGQVV
ncbi:MAG: SDR family NAD(P)-dependent oxidoreductase, partial [Proteobacteria bacterium]